MPHTTRSSSSIAALTALTLLVGALTLVAMPSHAQAQTDKMTEKTERGMQRYFQREKGGGIGFMTVGGASLVTGSILIFQESETVQGLGYPMIGLGLISTIVGAVVYLRTDGQVAELEALLEEDPARFKKLETDRMENVALSFDVIKTIEVLAILGGLSAAVVGKSDGNDLLRGVGLGVAAEATLLLGLDLIANSRAQTYIKVLNKFETDDDNADDGASTSSIDGAVLGIQGTW